MARSLAFPRRLRLVRESDFTRAYREGARARGTDLVVVVASNGLAHPRLGLSVGRSVWRSAVKRNRVRRLFREAFRLARHDLPPGIDVVMIPARPRLEPTLAGLLEELPRLVAKALASGSRGRERG